MTRTVLAAVALIGLAACGSGDTQHATPPGRGAATKPQTTAKAAPQKKKGATSKPDTVPAKNPLTND